MKEELVIGLCPKREAPGSVAGLNRFVEGTDLCLTITEDCGSLCVVDAGGKFERRGERDVAMALGWRPPDPRLRSNRDVADAASAILVDAALPMTCRRHARDVRNHAPARCELIVQ